MTVPDIGVRVVISLERCTANQIQYDLEAVEVISVDELDAGVTPEIAIVRGPAMIATPVFHTSRTPVRSQPFTVDKLL